VAQMVRSCVMLLFIAVPLFWGLQMERGLGLRRQTYGADLACFGCEHLRIMVNLLSACSLKLRNPLCSTPIPEVTPN
jgi:hypothetical protein